jgi:hypothetical protein
LTSLEPIGIESCLIVQLLWSKSTRAKVPVAGAYIVKVFVFSCSPWLCSESGSFFDVRAAGGFVIVIFSEGVVDGGGNAIGACELGEEVGSHGVCHAGALRGGGSGNAVGLESISGCSAGLRPEIQ